MQLNEEQRKLAYSKPGNQMLIRGVAGSGKTTVALHRALFLQQKYCLEGGTVLLLTYNKSLINYLDYIYETITIEDGQQQQATLFSGANGKVKKSTVDKLIRDYYYKAKGKDSKELIYKKSKIWKLFNDCISEVKKDFSDASLIDHNHSQFLFDEIDWIKSCNYMELHDYQKVDRIGRAKLDDSSVPQRLAKNSKERQAIFALMKHFDRRMSENGSIYYKDMALEAYHHASKNTPKTYKHIIIDEGQDLSRVQLEFIKTLYRNAVDSSFTLVADTAQSIYSHAWLVKGRSFSSVGFDMTGRSYSLTKNYRTSTQVAQTAYSMIEKDKNIVDCDDYVPPDLVDRQGQYPVLRPFDTERNESIAVFESIKSLLAQNYSYKDIAVIAREKNRLISMKKCLDDNKIPCEVFTASDSAFGNDQVQLLTIHAIKGLEYKVVFIITLNEGVIPHVAVRTPDAAYFQESNERKLLYVGMTRAREQLFMSYFGKPSKFVLDIAPGYLRSAPDKRIKSFYDVGVDNYIHKDKVRHLYGREEAVRQWVARELINTYRYPKAMIEFERKVGIGSKSLSLDIAVLANHKGSMAPFIVIETKAPGSDLSDGREQLKSYMDRVPTCKYGVLSDGCSFSVWDSEFELVVDLPFFHHSMRSYGGDTFIFSYLGSDTNHTLKIDYADDCYLALGTGRQIVELTGPDVIKVPIYERVAAGSAQIIDERVSDYFSLPTQWFKNMGPIYILKVKGDSMINAGIDDGDLIVVKKQNSAEKNEVVVVSLGDEAIVKRFSKTDNNTVLLQSENPNYAAHEVRTEQAHIMGVAIGVIKGK